MAWVSSGTVAYSHFVGKAFTATEPILAARGSVHGVELWRSLGAVAVGSGGLLLVLIAMAQARDSAVHTRRDAYEGKRARVARTGLIGVIIVTLAVLLALTVLPPVVVWGGAVVAWLILLVLFLSG